MDDTVTSLMSPGRHTFSEMKLVMACDLQDGGWLSDVVATET